MQYNLVQKAKAQQFKDACVAGAAISIFAFTSPDHQFEVKAVKAVWDDDRPVGYRVRVMDLNGFGVGYLGLR